jgi:hypothetical protein
MCRHCGRLVLFTGAPMYLEVHADTRSAICSDGEHRADPAE